MNQQQIRYLDKRITEMADKIIAKIKKTHEEECPKEIEKFCAAMKSEYKALLNKLDKNELVIRLLTFLTSFTENRYSFRGGNLVNIEHSAYLSCVNTEVILEIKGWVGKKNQEFIKLGEQLVSKRDKLLRKLDSDVSNIRDQINLGDAQEALDTMNRFADKWEKAIGPFQVEVEDED